MAELKRTLKEAAEEEEPTEAEEAWAAADDERPQDSQTIS